MDSAEASYRSDIDGLRAIAVVAVVLFHAFPTWLPGGFVGVDVFFVISGFLISGQLMATAAGQMSLAGFYARRIRRIFPALILVLATVAIAGWFLLLPHEWAALRRHIGTSAIFANNIVLWSETGYFDGPSEAKPLLHLWSLGVEEQFYLIWPLLIWWWWRRNVRWTVAIAMVIVISFAINVMVVADGSAAAAFFLPHTRLWQLATGAWLAALAREGVAPFRSQIARWLYRSPSIESEQRIANVMSFAGVLLIVLPCIALTRGAANPDWWSHGPVARVGSLVHWIARALWLDDAHAYPGWSALAPTLGAALVIAAGSGAALNRGWLSMRAMVFIGLISYPLYLWHWPILSFLQITELGDVSKTVKTAAIAASVLLASLTYFLVERPIRRGLTPVTLPRVAWLATPMAVIGIVMAIAINTGWLTPPARTALKIDEPVPMALNGGVCRSRFPGLGEYCQEFEPTLPVKTALLGDSHAAHFFPGLGEKLKQKGETLVHLGQTGCPPLIGIERINGVGDNSCTRVNRAMIDAVIADHAIINVWLSFRGALAVTGLDPGVDAGHVEAVQLFRASGGTATNGVAIRDALRATITLLQSHDKRVGVLLQVPELGIRVERCTGRPFSLAHLPALVPCAVPRAMVMERQASYRNLIAELQHEFGIAVYDPLSALCDESACHAVADGHVLYFDDNHLGVFGSSWALGGF